MISIKNLNISYKKETQVIQSLDLNLEDHAIHGIVGLNGAGKTTLLNGLFGLKKIDSGSIDHDGLPLTKKEIAYLITENFFYSNITGREYLNLFSSHDFVDDEWNELFMLPLNQIIDGYSTGMKKKLALMGILKQDKPIMILDEPFNGLDIETVRIIHSILLTFKEKGKTILITSHIIDTLTNLCDYIHYLEGGQIKFGKTKLEFSAFEKDIHRSIEEKNENKINDLLD